MKNLKNAMSSDDFQSVMQIIQSGQVDVNANVVGDPSGNTPLTYAVRKGKKEMVLYLLDHGVDPNKRDTNDHRSPLQWAACRGNIELVKILLDRGADIKQAHEALHEAAYQGHTDVLRELLSRGADVTAKDGTRTLLDSATLYCGDEIDPEMEALIRNASAAMPGAVPAAQVAGSTKAKLRSSQEEKKLGIGKN